MHTTSLLHDERTLVCGLKFLYFEKKKSIGGTLLFNPISKTIHIWLYRIISRVCIALKASNHIGKRAPLDAEHSPRKSQHVLPFQLCPDRQMLLLALIG